VDDYSLLPSAPSRFVIRAERAGYLTNLDAELVGRASVQLGAGRDRADDSVDPAVGIVLLAKPGAQVSAGDGILELHYREQAKLDAALVLATRAITIGDEAPVLRAIILGEVR
jgi:pyrimidine-nucleoside phosphorylase